MSWILAFSLISEMPYRALSEMSNTLNVMPTLMLGLIVAWASITAIVRGLVLGLFTLTVSIVLHDRLMYGAFGVLLPATMVLAVQRPWITWLLTCSLQRVGQ
ncbi:TraX family protein [Pseudomonas aeruginosa]